MINTKWIADLNLRPITAGIGLKHKLTSRQIVNFLWALTVSYLTTEIIISTLLVSKSGYPSWIKMK
jgi:hypothetical protein